MERRALTGWPPRAPLPEADVNAPAGDSGVCTTASCVRRAPRSTHPCHSASLGAWDGNPGAISLCICSFCPYPLPSPPARPLISGSDGTGPLCSPLPLAGPHLPAFTSLHEAALLLPRFSSCPSSTRERGVTAWLPGQQSPGPPTWTLPSLAACRLPSSQPLHIFARLLPPKRLSPHLRQHEGRSS